MARPSKLETTADNLGYEATLWLAADKLRNNMDAAEYKHVVLGLIFLKYISHTFEEHRAKLAVGKGDCAGANPVGKDEYRAENAFWVPQESTRDGFVIAFGRVGAYCGSIHWSLDGAWINNHASAVVPLQWPALVLQTMLNTDFNSMRTSSAQPFIPKSSLASAKVLRPSPEITEAFSQSSKRVGGSRPATTSNPEPSPPCVTR